MARLNGSLPDSEADWLKAHPGRSWEKERNKLLPGACVRVCVRAGVRRLCEMNELTGGWTDERTDSVPPSIPICNKLTNRD